MGKSAYNSLPPIIPYLSLNFQQKTPASWNMDWMPFPYFSHYVQLKTLDIYIKQI